MTVTDPVLPSILFDARHLTATGIGSYTRTCLVALSELQAERDIRVRLLCRPEDADEIPCDLSARRYTHASMYSLAEQALWACELVKRPPTMLWLPHYPTPWWPLRHTRLLVTVHDLTHVMPSAEGGLRGIRRVYATRMLMRIARRQWPVLTVSEHSKQQLLGLSSSLRGRVFVTTSEIAPEWFEGDVAEPPPHTAPYFIYVGNIRKHKGIETLYEAFQLARRELCHDLVIVGGSSSTDSSEGSMEAMLRSASHVHVLGRVDAETLRRYVRGATALVLPSLHEGLGLPPLEAMAAGTPCIVSDAPALRHAVGDSAIVTPRGDARALAYAMTAVAQDRALAQRLSASGRLHVSDRTRPRAVEELKARVARALVSECGVLYGA